MSMHEAEDVFDEPNGVDGDETGNESAAGSAPDDLRILEAVLFASDELMTAGYLKEVLPGRPDARSIRRMVEKINMALQKERHPFEIVEIGGGYQFRTITYYHPWVRRIFKEKAAKKLSIQALESLAVIAYKQPISKAEIEVIRGVISDGAMKTLLEKRLITVAGRSEKPGRPLLYGTTQTFLKYFGLNKIEDLPRIEEFEAMAREKMVGSAIDSFVPPETAPEEETVLLEPPDRTKTSASPVEKPAQSSFFEVNITASAAEGTAEPGGGDEPADFEIEAKPEQSIVAEPSPADAATAQPAASDHEVFEVDRKPPVSEGAADFTPKLPGQQSPASPAAAGKEPLPVKGPALRSETAFDLDAIIPQDDSVDREPAAIHIREKGPISGLELRGETVFDLEAIVIEEPVVKMPAASVKAQKAPAPAADNDNEETFEVKKAVAKKEAASGGGAAADVHYFEVGDTAILPAGFAAEHEKLAESLKETAVIKTKKPKRTSSIKTGGAGSKAAGGKTTRKKSAGKAVDDAVKRAGEKAPAKRTRRKSLPGAAGTP
ncbi:MAG: SMC-Scp complex subunit ScpB [Chitinispirillaceae bacterium]|nr:SMC-Scp complex subunit ScpB [Chitinispirillaceae bacterium]